jgi:flagellar basal body rod protein FlgG
MEATTSNLANLQTPGHKRMSLGTRAFEVPGGQPGETELTTFSQIDFSQGPLQPSANPYHMALEGSGFFAVEGPEGELYTRNGTFHVDERGILQSNEGYPVAWESRGTPIDATGEAISVDGSGQVRQGRTEIGRLRLVGFTAPEKLALLGAGYFQAPRSAGEEAPIAIVRHKMLEGSNVQSIDELVAMISIQREFEAARNVMQLIDQSYGRLTSR